MKINVNYYKDYESIFAIDLFKRGYNAMWNYCVIRRYKKDLSDDWLSEMPLKKYTASQKHESTLLHTYVLKTFLTADRSRTAKYF